MTNKCVVYGLSSSKDGEIRYIGQTRSGPKVRLKGHLTMARRNKTAVSKWIVSTMGAGHRIEMTVLVADAIWHETEILTIARYRSLGARLLNHTDGGEGTVGFSFKDRVPRKRPDLAELNRSRRGLPGRPRMPGETEKLMSYIRGSKRPWVSERNRAMAGRPGRKHTEAHKQHMREIMTGRERPADIGQKISAAKMGKPLSDAQKASLIRARIALAAKRRAA